MADRDLNKKFEEAVDLNDKFEQAQDLSQVAEQAPATQIQTPVQQTSGLEAAGRGLRKGSSLFLEDEADGLMQAGYGALDRAEDRISDAFRSGDISKVVVNPIEEAKRVASEYRFYRDDTRRDNAVAEAEHPYVSGASQFAGTMLNPLSWLTGVGGSAATGAIGGFGVAEGDLADQAKATALGAGLGAAGAAFPRVAKVTLPALGAATITQGEPGVTADDVAAGLGVVAGTVGPLANRISRRVATANKTGQKARSQLADKIREQDFVTDAEDAKAIQRLVTQVEANDAALRKDAISKVRKEERTSQGRQALEQKINSRIAELQENIQRYRQEDLANETIAKARQAEMAELQALKAQQKQQKVNDKRAQLNEKEAQLQERRGFKEQKQTVDEFRNEENNTNKKFSDWLKQRDKAVKARAKVRSDRNKARQELVRALSTVEDEIAGIDASAEGVRAKQFQTLATRTNQARGAYERENQEIPQLVNDMQKLVDQSYIKNTPGLLVTPDQAAQNYRASLAADASQRKLNAQKALEQFDATPFDEDAAVSELLALTPDREAYDYAKSLGLNPGEFEGFNPRKPMSLARTAPEAPEPLPSAEERGLAQIDAQRQKLDNPTETPAIQRKTDEQILAEAGVEPAPKRNRVAEAESEIEQLRAQLQGGPEVNARPESEILAEAGLDNLPPAESRIDFIASANNRAPVETRVQQQVDRAVPQVMDEIKDKALIGALSGAGFAGGAGAITRGTNYGVGGAVIGASAGAYFGAKQAIRALSKVNVETGKFENPAAVAAAMASLENVILKYPNLANKYLNVFKSGVSPVQAMFYIQNDPELARALDENAR